MTLSAHEIKMLTEINGWKMESVEKENAHGKYTQSFPVAHCYVVYRDALDGIQFGPVRNRQANCMHNADGTREDYWEVSPFPGAIAPVKLSQIISVRHPTCMGVPG